MNIMVYLSLPQAETLVLDSKDDFKLILRIQNTNVDGTRKVPFALRKIKGIGRRFAWVLCKTLRIDVNRRAGSLTNEEMEKVEEAMLDPEKFGIPTYLYNRQNDYKTGKWIHCVSNDLDTKLREDLQRLQKVM